MSIAIAGLLAGFIHVFSGPDHLAAIAPYAVDGKGRAWRTGIRWGLGHTAGVLGVGLLMLVLRDALPTGALSAWSERVVGFVLLGIGSWGMYKALARARRPHVHATHVHGREAFAVGTLHGLAGSNHLLGILPILALPSTLTAGFYLFLFGAGCVAAMGVFASLVGWVAGRPRAGAPRMQSGLMGLASLAAMIVGCVWVFSVP